MLAGADTAIDLVAGPWRAMYVAAGAVTVRHADAAPQRLLTDQGRALGRAAVSIQPESADTRFWVWEIDAKVDKLSSHVAGLDELLVHNLGQTPVLSGPSLCLRLERVDLNLGAETPVHTHAGPGLRVLVTGRLEAEVGDARLVLEKGDAWIELGPGERVVGRADAKASTAFVRLMLLPEDMVGRDSFLSWDEEEIDRPRPARYQRFFEERVIL